MKYKINAEKFFSAMTSLELWAFICIVSVFASLLFYAMILFKDQMIIQENIKQKPFARVRVCCTIVVQLCNM